MSPYFRFLSFPQKKQGGERQNKNQNQKKTDCKDKLINDRITWNANTQITNEGRTPNNITNVKLKPKWAQMNCRTTKQEEHKVIKYAGVLEERTATIFNVTKSGYGGWWSNWKEGRNVSVTLEVLMESDQSSTLPMTKFPQNFLHNRHTSSQPHHISIWTNVKTYKIIPRWQLKEEVL